MAQGIEVGAVVYGFAGGVFGRDSYEDKVVIATGVEGRVPWAVLRVVAWPAVFGEGLYFASGKRDFEIMAEHLTPEDEDF